MKRLAPWLSIFPILAAIWGVVHFATVAALREFAQSQLVMKEVYVQNQQTQDRELYRLQEQVEKLDERLDALERAK